MAVLEDMMFPWLVDLYISAVSQVHETKGITVNCITQQILTGGLKEDIPIPSCSRDDRKTETICPATLHQS